MARPMTNEPSSEAHSDKVWIIDAVCINCNKRFTSMHGVSMHLKMTGSCHVVNFINHGYYDKKTGLEMNWEVVIFVGLIYFFFFSLDYIPRCFSRASTTTSLDRFLSGAALILISVSKSS